MFSGALIAITYLGQRDTTWLIPRRCQAVVRVRKITAIISGATDNPTTVAPFIFCRPCQDPNILPQSHRATEPQRRKDRDRETEGRREKAAVRLAFPLSLPLSISLSLPNAQCLRVSVAIHLSRLRSAHRAARVDRRDCSASSGVARTSVCQSRPVRSVP